MAIRDLMNNYFYGKQGKADMTIADLPANRRQLFGTVLRVRWSLPRRRARLPSRSRSTQRSFVAGRHATRRPRDRRWASMPRRSRLPPR